MAFITGIIALHAPASALNNGKGEDNRGLVKSIRHGRYEYPYVTSQALRYWLRETIAGMETEWQASPIYRIGSGKQQAFTEGNPIRFWDDDLFGYMRAEKKDENKKGTITRIAPVRTSTLVSISPTEIVSDFGVMGRGDGNAIVHEHEFYRATLVGAFSIDLSSVGTFTYRDRSGYRNLNEPLIQQAQEQNLELVANQDAYRLPLADRIKRVATVLKALGRLQGGAKQTLHYTDVAPAFVIMAVIQGGNNPFIHLLNEDPRLTIHEGVLQEALTVYADEYQSPLHIGMRQGWADHNFELFSHYELAVTHPRQAFDELAQSLARNPHWFQ